MRRIAFLLTGIVCFLLCGQATAEKFTFEYQKNVEVPQFIKLEMNNKSGKVTIKGDDVDIATINAVKHIRAVDRAEAERISDHIEIKVIKDGSRITIGTNYLRLSDKPESFWEKIFGTGKDSYGSVDFNLIVPRECMITLSNTEGDIKIFNITESIHCEGTKGDIELYGIENDIDIETVSGDISLTDITGDTYISSTNTDVIFEAVYGNLDISTSSGDIEGSYLTGALSILQIEGKIEAKFIEGNCKIECSSGRVDIAQQTGAADITSKSGDIILKSALKTDRDCFIENGKGDIHLTIPQLASGKLKIETETGKIRADLPMTLDSFSDNTMIGTFGDGQGPLITIKTVSGNITVELY